MSGETERGIANWILTDHQSDHRRLPRLDLDMSMVARPRKDRSRAIQGRIIDLSCNGIRAAIAAELQVGDILELELGLCHTSTVVRLEAAIRWREGYQYGMEFMYLTASEREKMKQAITALACSGE